MAVPDSVMCSVASLDGGEPIYGTAAPKTTLWVLLEHTCQWHPRILQTPTLSPSLVARLQLLEAVTPGSRVQLIRRPGRADVETLRAYVISSREVDPRIWRFDLAALDDLLAFDLGAFALAEDPLPEARVDGPLFLVCTHGKRDPCCAKFGPAVFAALADDWGAEAVWQTSHIGGHRFAATMLCFPHGHCFGRVDAPAARRVAEGYAAGRLTDLRTYRGRTVFSHPVQAAEFFLREQTGVYGVEAFHYTRGEILSADRWLVCFEAQDSGEVHELTISRTLGPDLAPASCGKAPAPVARYHCDGHRQLPR